MDENNLSKKLFENYKMEKLPDDFTEKLMVKIEQATVLDKKGTPLFSKKFIILFTLTFLSIFGIGYYFQGALESRETTLSITELFKIPDYDFGKVLKLFNFEFEMSLFVKLLIISITILVVIDLLTGSLVDFFLDSKSKKENPQ